MTGLDNLSALLPEINRQSVNSKWAPALLAVALSTATAYLVSSGDWRTPVGLIFVLPAFVILIRYPVTGLITWLVLTQFLMTTENVADRQVYWVIHRGLPVLTVFLVVISAKLHIYRRKLPRLGWVGLAILGYVAVSLFSILTLNNTPTATAILFYDRTIVPVSLYLLARLSIQNERELLWLTPALFVVCVGQSIIGILSWSIPSLLPSTWLDLAGARATGSLDQPNTYTAVLVFSGLLLLHIGLNHRAGIVRMAFISAFVLSVVGIFLSFSRASWVGAIVLIPVLFYLYPKFTLRLGLVVIPVALFVGGWLMADEIRLVNQRLQASESALSRLPVYYAAIRMFEAKPLFGWGYENFDQFDRQFQGRVADLVNPEKDHASHSLFLTVIAEQGLIGALLFLTPTILLLIASFKALPRLPAEGLWSRKLVIILWMVIVHYIVVTNFANMRVVYGLGVWWLTLGLIGSVLATVPATQEQTINSPMPKGLLANGTIQGDVARISSKPVDRGLPH